jgi:hypothetical protein
MSSLSLSTLETVPSSGLSIALSEPNDSVVTLRVSGSKPIRMHGELLAECSSWSAGATAWHELLLYRRQSGDFAAGIKTCRGAADGTPRRGAANGSDVFHARIFPDLNAALGWVQSFNPTADLGADIDSSDRRISTTDIALRAATLRQHTDRVEQQYRVMVGELLYRLEIEE